MASLTASTHFFRNEDVPQIEASTRLVDALRSTKGFLLVRYDRQPVWCIAVEFLREAYARASAEFRYSSELDDVTIGALLADDGSSQLLQLLRDLLREFRRDALIPVSGPIPEATNLGLLIERADMVFLVVGDQGRPLGYLFNHEYLGQVLVSPKKYYCTKRHRNYVSSGICRRPGCGATIQ